MDFLDSLLHDMAHPPALRNKQQTKRKHEAPDVQPIVVGKDRNVKLKLGPVGPLLERLPHVPHLDADESSPVSSPLVDPPSVTSPSAPASVPTPQLIDQEDQVDAACKRFRRCKLLAVDCEGSNLGREGTLTLVQVASESDVMLFDILNLRSAAFSLGLRRLLEDSSVIKVMHDCRRDVDALQQLFGVHVNNVFDTQVAFAVLCRQEMSATPLPASLNTVLRKYARGAENVYKQVPFPSCPFLLRRSLWSV